MATIDAAFLALLEQHRKIVLKVAYAYCRDANAREDLSQTIVAELWRAFPRYDNRCAFATWMYRISVNVAISFHRRESRHRDVLPAGDTLPEHVMNDNGAAARDLLHEYLDRLDDLSRALVILHLDGYSYDEIAQILGISSSNVGTKLSRIKLRLREAKESIHGIR